MRTDEPRSSGTKPKNPGAAPPAGPLPPGATGRSGQAVTPEVGGLVGGMNPALQAQVAAALAAVGSGAGDDDPPVWVGDHAAPLSRVNLNFYNLTPGQLRAFQGRMHAAGVLKEPRYGDYDEETYGAWQMVNERAARFYATGKKFSPATVLDMVTANAPEGAGQDGRGRDGRPGFIDAVSNKLDLEEQIQSAARGRLNRKLKPAEVAKFVAVFQGMQRQSFAQANAATLAATGGEAPEGGGVGTPGQSSTLVGPAGVEAAGQQFIDANFAQEAAGVDTLGAFSVIERMLAGGGNG